MKKKGKDLIFSSRSNPLGRVTTQVSDKTPQNPKLPDETQICVLDVNQATDKLKISPKEEERAKLCTNRGDGRTENLGKRLCWRKQGGDENKRTAPPLLWHGAQQQKRSITENNESEDVSN